MFFADYSPLIGTCNVYLQTDCDDGHIDVQNDQIIFSNDKEMKTFILCRGVTLLENSTRVLIQSKGWICFRIKLKWKPIVVNCVLEQLTSELNAFNWEDKVEIQDLVTNRKVTCNCRKCGASTTKHMELSKYCSLPNIDFCTASENWFCCNHGTHTASTPRSSLTPKPNECFYSEFLYCTNISNLLGRQTKEVICCLCNSELGFVEDNMLKLWSNEVKWVSNDKVLIEKTNEDILVSLCEELEKDSMGVNSRLIFANEKAGGFLIVIIMDVDHMLLMSDDCLLLQRNQEASIDLTEKKLKTSANSFKKLQKKKCLKVLYNVETKQSDQWIDDVNTHVHVCSSNFFVYLKALLDCSNACIAPDMRKCDDLNIGYILK